MVAGNIEAAHFLAVRYIDDFHVGQFVFDDKGLLNNFSLFFTYRTFPPMNLSAAFKALSSSVTVITTWSTNSLMAGSLLKKHIDCHIGCSENYGSDPEFTTKFIRIHFGKGLAHFKKRF
jgi:hypothetical protein